MKKAIDLAAAIRHLDQEGYVVLEGILDRTRLQRIRGEVDRLFEQEQRQPFDPGDGPEGPDDDCHRSLHLGELHRLGGRSGSNHEEDPPHPCTQREYLLAGAPRTR